MFIDKMNPEQQSALLGFAEQIINSDGHVDVCEETMLGIIRSQMAPSVQKKDIPIEDIANVFPSRADAVYLLLELIGVAYADGDFHPTERELCSQIGKQLNLCEDDLLALDTWCQRQFALVAEVSRLIKGE